MASYFNLTLDTLAPSGVSVSINGGATVANVHGVTLTICCGDGTTAGYTMKLYGDIGTTGALSEADASWESFAASKAVTLYGSDGQKTVKLKIRDDVYNESSEATASITLDTTVPIVTITGPDVTRISQVVGKDACAFAFRSGEAFVEYQIKVVPDGSSAHTASTAVTMTNGSTHMSGTGSFAKDTAIQCVIRGADYAAAVGGSDGAFVVKAFVRDAAGLWSV